MKLPISFILEAASLLAAFIRTSHIVTYAPGGSQICRLDATPIILGINEKNYSKPNSFSSSCSTCCWSLSKKRSLRTVSAASGHC
ncbi:MAG TPA: hypothetical protein DHV72_05435 [Serratia grimesii]|uniref:Uncharacterized protein n=1 Tax=Serratia grimesii TaxID=82995 RepID=A0A9C7QSC1_9GAMM|nr:hypothetical protein [Serratia grimesii]